MPWEPEEVDEDMRERAYYQAVICDNGHVLSATGDDTHPDFCPDCGAGARVMCPKCRKAIRGPSHESSFLRWRAPGFCHACGAPFPWTTARREAFELLAAETEELTPEDRELMSNALPDLAIEGPRSELAASRVRRVLRKMTGGARAALYKIAVDISSETAVKILKGG